MVSQVDLVTANLSRYHICFWDMESAKQKQSRVDDRQVQLTSKISRTIGFRNFSRL